MIHIFEFLLREILSWCKIQCLGMRFALNNPKATYAMSDRKRKKPLFTIGITHKTLWGMICICIEKLVLCNVAHIMEINPHIISYHHFTIFVTQIPYDLTLISLLQYLPNDTFFVYNVLHGMINMFIRGITYCSKVLQCMSLWVR